MNAAANKKSPLVYLLTLGAIALLAVIYYTSIWWVSLTAPNYPPESFPDGVRIEFHMNGVFNGCKKVEKKEIEESEALDCVHEMDTINHYVGMYPIAAGGVIERAFSPFLVSMLGVMLIGFMLPDSRLRTLVMAAGFGVIVVWMTLYFYTDNGLRYENEGYVSALVTALDQGSGDEPDEEVSPGEALIEQLQKSLAKSGVQVQEDKAAESGPKTEKERLIDNLRVTFEKEQENLPPAERKVWNGSGAQVLAWHYGKSLGRYFNNPAEIKPMVARMSAAAHVVYWGLIAAMLLLLWGARKTGSLLYWLLVVVPMALPVFFVIDYSAWLWWYGHRLNSMGAFTVKPFMPTVFGDGKVAQFATHSYPDLGFGLMLVLAVMLALAALLKRKELRMQRG